jgi:hypothetical protein
VLRGLGSIQIVRAAVGVPHDPGTRGMRERVVRRHPNLDPVVVGQGVVVATVFEEDVERGRPAEGGHNPETREGQEGGEATHRPAHPKIVDCPAPTRQLPWRRLVPGEEKTVPRPTRIVSPGGWAASPAAGSARRTRDGKGKGECIEAVGSVLPSPMQVSPRLGAPGHRTDVSSSCAFGSNANWAICRIWPIRNNSGQALGRPSPPAPGSRSFL